MSELNHNSYCIGDLVLFGSQMGIVVEAENHSVSIVFAIEPGKIIAFFNHNGLKCLLRIEDTAS